MTELVFTLKGPMPPSKKNSKRIFARGGKAVVIPSEGYREWHKKASRMAQDQRLRPKVPLARIKSINVYFHPQDKRRRDIDNMITSIFDWLVDFGILAGDSWQVIPELHSKVVGVDKENPRVDVKIVY